MPRTTVFCVVEGQTENAVLKRLVSPHLGLLGVDFHAPIVKIGRSRGGVKFLEADDLYAQIHNFLKDRRQPHVTTFFDYYAFPTGGAKGWDFVPGVKSEASIRGLANAADKLEAELKRRAIEGLDLPNLETRLLPYVQLHELEALFFAEPEKIAETLGNPTLARIFQGAVVESGGCENINDRPQTAPSKRIESAFPGYIKGRSDFAHGPRIAEKLELTVVRQQCPRFDAWVARMESLSEQPF